MLLLAMGDCVRECCCRIHHTMCVRCACICLLSALCVFSFMNYGSDFQNRRHSFHSFALVREQYAAESVHEWLGHSIATTMHACVPTIARYDMQNADMPLRYRAESEKAKQRSTEYDAIAFRSALMKRTFAVSRDQCMCEVNFVFVVFFWSLLSQDSIFSKERTRPLTIAK